MFKIPSNFSSKPSNPVSYRPPAQGLLSYLPASWIPYAELTRLTKPTGIVVIYLPYLFGLFFAAITTSPPTPALTLLSSSSTLLLASFVLRSAGCTWNDVVDYKLDQKVARCRLRPIARGAVSPSAGALFFAAQILVWLAILWQVRPRSLLYAGPGLAMVVFYPYAKRLTDYPQLVLGVTLAWGMLPGCVVSGVDPVALWTENWHTAAGLGCLFVAYVAWTAIYDTIYAYQDVRDDTKAGIRSMAVRWRHRAKMLLAGLAIVKVVFLEITGWVIGAGTCFYVGACGGSAVGLGTMIWSVDLEEPRECGWWFQYGIWIVGGCVSGGLVAEYMNRASVV